MPFDRDILGIGMALMDCFVLTDDSALRELELPKGGTTFVEGEHMDLLLARARVMGLKGRFPGDNARNLCEAAALAGARSTFLGAIGTDLLADDWIAAMLPSGVACRLQRFEGRTGCAIAFITPDGERTFALHMGVSDRLSELPHGWPEGFRYLYTTSTNLLEPSGAQRLTMLAMERARVSGVQIAMSLENPSLLETAPGKVRELLSSGVHALFANHEELCCVFGPDHTLQKALEVTDLLFAKHGGDGSVVLSRSGERWNIPVFPARVIDTTGAGDFYAGATLALLSRGRSPDQAARLGSYLAAQVVSTLGARLPDGLKLPPIDQPS